MKKLTEFFLPDCSNNPRPDKSSALSKTTNAAVRRPLVIVCPGGGYTHLSDREAEPVAIKFNSLGFHSAVLRYAVFPHEFPEGLLDLFRTIKHYKKNAEKFGIDKSKIFVTGFSAGAHLAACAGLFWNKAEYSSILKCTPEQIKPDALCLCYPVITAGKYAHKNSFISLTRTDKAGQTENNYSPNLYTHLSLEKQVSKDCPPVFLWHTLEDTFVPAENSVLFFTSLRKHNIPCEMHLFAKGQHGIALATEQTSRENNIDVIPECQVWPELFKSFISSVFK